MPTVQSDASSLLCTPYCWQNSHIYGPCEESGVGVFEAHEVYLVGGT